MSSGAELDGYTVGVTADRRAGEQADLLVALGARVLHGPVIATLPAGDDPALRAVTEGLIADPPDYLVAISGGGIRWWMEQATAWGLDRTLRKALGQTRVAARGPKASAAVGAAGLDVWWRAESEQLWEVTQRLLCEPLAGRRVAVQLAGEGRLELSRRVAGRGAQVIEVPVYRWALPEDPAPALRLIEMASRGTLDALTFTAGPAVRNFMALADRARRGRNVLETINSGAVAVVCVGPVCAAVAVEEGIEHPRLPDVWRLEPMVRLVADELSERRRRYRVGEIEMVMQGSVVTIDGEPVRLTDRERAVLAKLVERPGAMISRRVLLRHVWKDPSVDPGVVESTVGRLRSKLGPSGAALETAVRRGYRLRARTEGPAGA